MNGLFCTFRAHPTVHAFSHTDDPVGGARNRTKPMTTINSYRRTRYPEGGGTVWSDPNTRPLQVAKTPTPRVKKKSIDSEFKLSETEDISLRFLLSFNLSDSILALFSPRNEVKKGLQRVQRRHMKSLMPNFRNIDKLRTGKLPPEKVRQILQLNQVNILFKQVYI